MCDVSGLSRVIGDPADIAREIQSVAAREGVPVRLAIAVPMSTAWILAHARPGATVVPAGHEAVHLASLPLAWLGTLAGWDAPGGGPRGRAWSPAEYQTQFATCARWGVRTVGDLAALPRADLHARLGPLGVHLHQAACGEDAQTFAPLPEAPVFLDRLVLDWPIEGLEPLAFVLARQCDRLSAALDRADRGAVAIRTTLELTRPPGAARGEPSTHVRELTLPAPLRDARVLRTLILLDLESHPPSGSIEAVTVQCEVVPGAVLQGMLFTRPVPNTADLTTLLARLGALMGGSRVGSPQPVDTHDARDLALAPFDVRRAEREGAAPPVAGALPAPCPPTPVVRRFRVPVAAQVVADRGAPRRIVPAARGLGGGEVVGCAGPWRTAGQWWGGPRAWDRDEWDVELTTGDVYRVARDRGTDRWTIDGILD
jgi:protein ImuB